MHSTAWNWNPCYGPEVFGDDWRKRTVWGGFVYDSLGTKNTDPVRPG